MFTATADNSKDSEEHPLLWAPTGLVAPPSGPEAARTAPKAAEAPEQQQLLPAGAQPDPAAQAGYATTTSYTVTRPTTALATAPGRETKLPGRCQRHPPMPPGLPQGPQVLSSTRAAPSHIPTRGTSVPKEPQRSLLSSNVLHLYMFAAAVPNRCSHLLTAGHLLWSPTPLSSSFWT